MVIVCAVYRDNVTPFEEKVEHVSVKDIAKTEITNNQLIWKCTSSILTSETKSEHNDPIISVIRVNSLPLCNSFSVQM